MLATLPLKQGMTKVVMQANRNGLFYVLDRATGKVLLARPFVQTAWAKSVGADGRPIVPERPGHVRCVCAGSPWRDQFSAAVCTIPLANCFS